MGGGLSLRHSIGEHMVKLESNDPGAWATTLEQVLDGVTHQLSNRVALLAGISEILGRDDTIPPILRALADEVPKLEEMIRLLRLLTAPSDEVEEPATVTRLIDDAITLAGLHAATKDVHFAADGDSLAPPVLVFPTRCTHRVLMACVAAASDGGQALEGSATIPVIVREDGDDVLIRVGHHATEGMTVRVPTLQAARARAT